MTGRELIIYILENRLEDKKISWFMTVEEAAVKFKVGVETVKVWYSLGFISGITIGDTIYILDKQVL